MAASRIPFSQRGAVAARTLLAMFVVFGLVVFFVPTAPLGDQQARAQATSPSPSSTGARIQFLNPSGTTANSTTSGPGKEVSAKQDADTAYHLVAWVGSMPSNPSVEFKYSTAASGSPDTLISTGTLRGSDTYDTFWNLGSLTDGTYYVKAILYSNGAEVSRDTEQVVVNNQASNENDLGVPEDEDTGETVEISYPAQAGSWGAFRKPGTTGPYAGVVRVTASEGTNNVRAYYTTSAPGSEPSWTRCSTADGETLTDAANGVRCTLASGVNPTSVTAIAAAAGDADQSAASNPPGCVPAAQGDPCGEGEDSGDAHRTTGYAQIPGSVTVTPTTQTQTDTATGTAGEQFDCSSVIAGTVLDQFQVPVAGANADVHASGPTENLYFDDPDATSNNHQPPDSNNHSVEQTVDCETSSANPRNFNTSGGANNQGDHEAAGEGDVKHVETTSTGTNDAGEIRFRLYNRSTSITGTTQITVFYDRDDDDTFCSAEPHGDATIGWGGAASATTGVTEEESTCPEPSASPSSSSTASSSPSSSPSSSSSSSASPSGSPTPGTARTIGLSASDEKVNAGKTVTLTGQIVSNDESCEDSEFVRIRRRVHGTDSFENFRSTTSDASGQFSVSFTANQSASYDARVSANDGCAESSSQDVAVLVKVNVSIFVSEFRPDRGDKVRILGKVTPKHAGSKVVLQRKKGGRWVKVGRDELNDRSRYKFVLTADWRRDRVFRVKWIPNHADHEAGKSQNVKVTVRR